MPTKSFRDKVLDAAATIKAKYQHQTLDWDIAESLSGKALSLALLGLIVQQEAAIRRLEDRIRSVEREARHSNKR